MTGVMLRPPFQGSLLFFRIYPGFHPGLGLGCPFGAITLLNANRNSVNRQEAKAYSERGASCGFAPLMKLLRSLRDAARFFLS
jgi:hypothetical protein